MQTNLQGRHVVFFSWRDTRNPEGGGAEVYLEVVARGLAARGAAVTIFCAAHDQAASDEVVDGIRFVRRGSKLSVYARGLLLLAGRRFGRVDLVVDVQNGLPFFTRMATRRPVVVLVHHVHREQWPVVYPGIVGRVGWYIESRLAPRLYRRCQYVAVSRATREELVALGVDHHRVTVVHNGTASVEAVDVERAARPQVCSVGRLVPHKQVEHAIDAVVALRDEVPGIRLVVVGSGWWGDKLKAHARAVEAGPAVVFEGHVDETRKQQIYAESWVMALPSLKEGWGLVIGEAGAHGVPTVAYRSAGGTQESIDHSHTGLLADDYAGFLVAMRSLVTDPGRRSRLGAGARRMSHRYTWGHAQGSFASVVEAALERRAVTVDDPDETA